MVEITAGELGEAFVEFESVNGRQPKVLAVPSKADEAPALHVVQDGHVGHLTVVVDEELKADGWELRESATHRTPEQMGVDAAAIDGRVQPYAGLPGGTAHEPS